MDIHTVIEVTTDPMLKEQRFWTVPVKRAEIDDGKYPKRIIASVEWYKPNYGRTGQLSQLPDDKEIPHYHYVILIHQNGITVYRTDIYKDAQAKFLELIMDYAEGEP